MVDRTHGDLLAALVHGARFRTRQSLGEGTLRWPCLGPGDSVPQEEEEKGGEKTHRNSVTGLNTGLGGDVVVVLLELKLAWVARPGDTIHECTNTVWVRRLLLLTRHSREMSVSRHLHRVERPGKAENRAAKKNWLCESSWHRYQAKKMFEQTQVS